MRGLLIVSIVVLSVSPAASRALRATGTAPAAQAHGGHMSPAQARKIALAVDGAVTPDAVSDDLAYILFFRALSSSPAGSARVDGVLRKVGLAPADRSALAGTLLSVAGTIESAAQQRQSAANGAQLAALERQAAEEAREHVRAALSTAGWEQLDRYVRTHVKRHIVIYRG